MIKIAVCDNSEYNLLALFVHKIRYEAKEEKTCVHSITLQPLVADHAITPHMKDMYVPYHMGKASKNGRRRADYCGTVLLALEKKLPKNYHDIWKPPF